ncbi:hypothetical protein D0Z00_003892 [Geotrichum galactomycetum]|uniref:Uncharacterized protein n=1 Tax=Geotrichum galactomycetum TaxID=27317 RepID=A0ACB6V010_9ASCO|nr:hypothetical protein D0Z00_003892 [Geotrichum candidum]
MDPTATDDEPKAEITRCICGHDELQPGQIHNLHRQRKNFDPDFFIQCDSCHVWQHGYCVGILNDQEAPEGYYCEKCRPDYHVIVVRPSGRTSKYSPQEYSDEEEEEDSKAPPPKEKEVSREERASRQRKEKEVTLQEPDQDEPSRTANSSSSSRRDRKRRLTVNSTRDEAAYEETLRRVLEESVHDDEHRDAKAAFESIKAEAALAITVPAPPASSTSSSRNKKRRQDSPSGSDESARTSASSSKRTTKSSNGNSNNGNSKQASTIISTAPGSGKNATAPAAPASPSPQAAVSKKSEKRKRRHNASDDHSSRATSHLHTSGATASASGKSYIDKPSKPRIPQSRISIPEMQKRVAAILEFIARTRLDLDIEERERRQLLDIRLVRYKQLYKPEPVEGNSASGTTTSNNSNTIDPEQDRHLNDPKFGSLVNGFSKSLTLMDTLTAKLSDWEQRYGAYGK